jgi:hypothetical protein
MSATIRSAAAFVVVGLIFVLAAVFVGSARADVSSHTQKPPRIGSRHGSQHGRLRCADLSRVTSCGVAATVAMWPMASSSSARSAASD